MKKKIIFLSDVHLSPEAPQRGERFVRFLEALPEGTEIYVLGDLLDAWVETPRWSLADRTPQLSALKRHRAFLLFGNRDFLAGPALESATGGRVLGEFHALEIEGRRILLLHGDRLCTRDHSYQRWRRFVRSRPVRLAVRFLPRGFMERLSARLRRSSGKEKERKSLESMEIVPRAVENQIKKGYDEIVCGHVHSPRIESYELDGRTGRLVVLSDWDAERVMVGVWEDGRVELRAVEEVVALR